MGVLDSAASTAVAGSAFGPWGTLAGGLAGGLIGGIGGLLSGSAASSRAKAAAREYAGKAAAGRKALAAGRAGVTEGFSPYTQLGSQMASQYGTEVAKGQSQPTFSYTPDEFNFSTTSDPGAQYRMEQSNKALQASAIAKGGMGGGFAKALQANSQGLASQEYANSWNRNMEKNKFGYTQAADQYTRDYTSQQDYLNRLKSGSETGQAAAGTLGGLQQGYDSGTNSSWISEGEAALKAAGLGNEYQTGGETALTGGLGSALGTGLQGLFSPGAGGTAASGAVVKRGANWLGTAVK